MIGHGDHVIGHHGDLAAAPRSIHYKSGNGVPGGVSPQTFNDLNTLGNRRAEVTRAFDQVALVQVVWSHADAHQFMDQLALDMDAVIDSGQ